MAVDRNRAADLGVSLETVGRTLETMLGSRIVTTYVDRGREYNVILQGRADERATTTDLTNIQVRSDRTGQLIPLANLVTLQETAGAVSLNRFNRLRTIEISAGLAPGYTMGEAVKWFQDTVREKLPPGAALAFDGESGEYLKSGSQLYTTFVFALAIVFLVLAAQFESFVHPAIIMVTVPLALLGAVFGLKLYGLSINIFSQIAVVMLIGIAAKNGVLIVEFANQLRDRGVEFTEAIVEAAVDAPAPGAHDEPLHGLRRAAVPVRDAARAPSSASPSASWCSTARWCRCVSRCSWCRRCTRWWRAGPSRRST